MPEYQWLLIEALRNNGQTQQALVVETRLKRTAIVEDQRTYALYLASLAGDVALAEQLAQNELTVRQDVFTKDALAWSLFAAQQIPEALELIEQALSEGMQDARLFYHAALITRAVGSVSSIITLVSPGSSSSTHAISIRAAQSAHNICDESVASISTCQLVFSRAGLLTFMGDYYENTKQAIDIDIHNGVDRTVKQSSCASFQSYGCTIDYTG